MPAIDTHAKGVDLSNRVAALVRETKDLSDKHQELKDELHFRSHSYEPIVHDYVKRQLALNFRALDAISLIMEGLLNESI